MDGPLGIMRIEIFYKGSNKFFNVYLMEKEIWKRRM